MMPTARQQAADLKAAQPPATQLNLPSWATILVGLVAGLLTAFVHNSFGIGQPWKEYATILLVMISVLGINALVGTAFRNALHLSPAVSLVITAILTGAAVGASKLGWPTDVVGWVQGAIAFLGALGFGTLPIPVALRRRFI